MAKEQAVDDMEPGVFKPALPTTTEGVLRAFAIAGRAVVHSPERLEGVSETLVAMARRLVPPESLAAQECAAIWGVFMRLAGHGKGKLREEAGGALYRDLDGVCRKLDLPPMPSWASLPEGIIEPGAIDLNDRSKSDGATLTEVKAKARAKARQGAKAPLKPDDVLRLLKQLSSNAQATAWDALVADGVLRRPESAMLSRNLGRSNVTRREDTVLLEALQRVGEWLLVVDAEQAEKAELAALD